MARNIVYAYIERPKKKRPGVHSKNASRSQTAYKKKQTTCDQSNKSQYYTEDGEKLTWKHKRTERTGRAERTERAEGIERP